MQSTEKKIDREKKRERSNEKAAPVRSGAQPAALSARTEKKLARRCEQQKKERRKKSGTGAFWRPVGGLERPHGLQVLSFVLRVREAARFSGRELA